MLRTTLGLVTALALLAGGCIIFTGGTDGYTAAEAGPPGAGASCKSSTDCSAGTQCCYGLDAGAAAASCQASCGETWAQACGQASDCGDGGECLVQSCTVSLSGFSETASVATCGPIPFCTQ